MRKVELLFAAAALLLFPTFVVADTLNVDCGNPSPPPGSFSSISGALSALSFIDVIGSVTCDGTGFLWGELGGIGLIDCKNVIVQKKSQ